MGVCDSCFAESAPEREYEPINNNTVESSSAVVNEKSQLMQSYQQPNGNPMQQQQQQQYQQPALVAQKNIPAPAPAPASVPVPAPTRAPAVPAPAPAAAPLSVQTSEVDNVTLHDIKSVAPPVSSARAASPVEKPAHTQAAAPRAVSAAPSAVQQKGSVPSQEQDDPTSGVFEGLELLQKFTNKSSYDTRFIWINMQTNTMHMSQYMTKDRRHKEASLSEVTSVEEARPAKVKSVAPIDPSLCLTINFKRGGGIDLLFKTTADRNEWVAVLKRIITSNQANDAAQAQAHAQAQ
jgi:hypothetical protein